MTERADLVADFLAAAGWGDARHQPLAGDASQRRYVHLRRGDESAILMDAPTQGGAETDRFLRAGAHLAAAGLSVPAPIRHDAARGLVLMEDLGDATLAELAGRSPGRIPALYRAASDVLIQLQRMVPPDWAARYDAAGMAAAIRPAWDSYVRSDGSEPSVAWLDLEACLGDLLARHAPDCSVLLHRDYHAENLLWLPDRAGVARVGVLDFQDALAGHPAYDLASLLQDARRDVAPAVEAAVIARFVRLTGRDADAFGRAYALQAAQRHLRILGVFARLARTDGKPRYLAFLPRVWSCLERALSHPDLAGLRTRVLGILPRPETLSRETTP